MHRNKRDEEYKNYAIKSPLPISPISPPRLLKEEEEEEGNAEAGCVGGGRLERGARR